MCYTNSLWTCNSTNTIFLTLNILQGVCTIEKKKCISLSHIICSELIPILNSSLYYPVLRYFGKRNLKITITKDNFRDEMYYGDMFPGLLDQLSIFLSKVSNCVSVTSTSTIIHDFVEDVNWLICWLNDFSVNLVFVCIWCKLMHVYTMV